MSATLYQSIGAAHAVAFLLAVYLSPYLLRRRYIQTHLQYATYEEMENYVQKRRLLSGLLDNDGDIGLHILSALLVITLSFAFILFWPLLLPSFCFYYYRHKIEDAMTNIRQRWEDSSRKSFELQVERLKVPDNALSRMSNSDDATDKSISISG